MITCGMDIGSFAIKLIIMKEEAIIASRIIPTGKNVRTSANNLLKKTLKELFLDKVDRCVATGSGKKKAFFADEVVSDIVADTYGVTRSYPSAQTIIDIGAEEVRAVKCNPDGTILNYLRNNRCGGAVRGLYGVETGQTFLKVVLGKKQ